MAPANKTSGGGRIAPADCVHFRLGNDGIYVGRVERFLVDGEGAKVGLRWLYRKADLLELQVLRAPSGPSHAITRRQLLIRLCRSLQGGSAKPSTAGE